MDTDPMEVFAHECPELSKAFENLVYTQAANSALDPKTKQLINLAIQTANRNVRGVYFHAMMAKRVGATKEEVVAAVAMNLHLSGLGSVLDCLPQAVKGYEAAG